VANPQKPNPADYLSRMRNLFLRMSGIVRQLLDKFGSQRVAAIRFPVPFGPKSINERRRFLSPIYKLIRYHRLIFDSVADGVFRSTFLVWTPSGYSGQGYYGNCGQGGYSGSYYNYPNVGYYGYSGGYYPYATGYYRSYYNGNGYYRPYWRRGYNNGYYRRGYYGQRYYLPSKAVMTTELKTWR
jgi:hypothetical protein